MDTKFLFSLALALTTASACGDKSKKKTAASTAANDTPAAVSTEEPIKADNSDSTPDPASLEEVVYFGFDQADLDDEARAKLQENYEWMKEDDSRVLTIEGHTDETGTSDYNLALGERRARVTRDYLVRLGVDADRVQIITYGEERPASSTEDALNRRSVFVATRK